MIMKFGICNEIFKDWEMDRAMRFIGETGYDAVEIAPFTLADYVTDITPGTRRKVRSLAEGNGLEISAVHWVLVQAEGMHMTHPDAAVRERTRAYFRDLVDFCSDLGGRAVVVGSPRQRSLMPGVDHGQALGFAREVFGPAVKRAEEKGVVICLEPLAPSETDFINTAREAIDFIRDFDSQAFRIILDVKAMCSMGRPVPDIIRDSAGQFAYFHANDSNLKGPGFGSVDFVPIARALREAGYDGCVSVEVFDFTEGPEAIATRSLEYLRKCFGTD